MSKLPSAIKNEAILMRKRGYSLQEIAESYKIAKSTASLWMKKISLNKEAQRRLAGRAKIGQTKTKEIKRKKRESLLSSLQEEAHKDIANIIHNRCVARLLCAVLFWCEGSKTMSLVKFTNSDPEMVKYFLALLRKGFTLDESKFRALVHLHEYHDENTQIDFWAKITGVPKNQFHQSYHKPHTQKRMRENYPGCICVTYYDAQLAKILWAYYKEAPRLLGA